MADTRPQTAAEYKNITVTGQARVHLGNNHVSNSIYITNTLARDVYRACMKSSSSFGSLAKDVASFRSLLDMTEDAIVDHGLDSRYAGRVTTVVSACKDCLDEIQVSVANYNGLPIATQRTWERMQWGAEEISELEIRLQRNISILSTLNSTLSSSSQRAVKEMLQKFIDEVRAGKREGSVASRQTVDSLTMDEREAWRELRKELEDVGITPSIFTQHRDLVTRTLQDAISAGLLEEASPSLGVIQESQTTSSRSSFTSAEDFFPIPVIRDQHMPIRQGQTQPLDNYGKQLEETLRQLNEIESGKESYGSTPSGDFSRTTRVTREDRYKPGPPLRAMRLSIGARALNTIFGQNKKFLSAVAARDLKTARQYLGLKVDIETENDTGQTALIIACEMGSIDIVKLLVLNGANIEAEDRNRVTPLFIACRKGHKAIAEYLIQNGADMEVKDSARLTPLLAASSKGDMDIGKLLIDSGAKVNVEDIAGRTPAMEASTYGNLEILQLLVNAGADINKDTCFPHSPLTSASRRGNDAIVRFLCENGAHLEAVAELGQTALLYASAGGYYEITRFLIDRGANFETADSNGVTPLMIASETGHGLVVRLLLDNGADINRKSKHGNTALSIARGRGQISVAQLLLERGASFLPAGSF